jgi:diguanylate cyclase (GGDEF)-like protein
MPLSPNAARTATLVAGAACALLGLLVLLGWHLHVPLVIQIHPAFAPMQYNTALGFLLGGSGLLAAQGRRRAVSMACALGVALIGLLTLLTHIFASDIGLDQLFMQHYITVASSRPGRMAPNTALCFLLIGSALLLTGAGAPLRRRWHGVCLLAALAIGLSLAALMGYVVGIPGAYGWGNLTRMAVHTALGFVTLGLGLITLSAQAPRQERGWQPWAIGVIVSTLTVTLWQALLQANANVGHAGEFVLAFGLLMALALGRAVAYSLELQRAAEATALALAQLGQEMQERKKAEEQVRRLAFYDMLTGLPNRLLLNERLQQGRSASKRSGHFGAVLFLDLDNFKPLNDRHGHAVGDLLLVEVAQRLLRCVRETDTVARFGGDEFVLVLSELAADPDLSAAQALQVADKVQAALSAPYRLAPTAARPGQPAQACVEHHCSVSIGLALFDAQSGDVDEILKGADAAMYQAKAAGRHAIRMHPSASRMAGTEFA